MNFLRYSVPSSRSGFTLVEILVAIAILSIVAVGLLQILNLSVQTWQQGMIRTNCYIKARTVLDTAVADIQRGEFRSELHNFPTPSTTMPTFTFYTRWSPINYRQTRIYKAICFVPAIRLIGVAPTLIFCGSSRPSPLPRQGRRRRPHQTIFYAPALPHLK
jgi:prepilin-type N-terminal cleavage/methylation domain-containing protein